MSSHPELPEPVGPRSRLVVAPVVSRRSRWPRTALRLTAGLTVLSLAGVLGAQWWLDAQVSALPTFGDASIAAAAPGTDKPAELNLPPAASEVESFLIFSVGSAGLSEEEAEQLGVASLDQRGVDKLTDVLILAVADPSSGTLRLLSIPRDLWMPEYDSRINAVYLRHGPQALADAVVSLTGVPVNHLVSVNFAGFAQVVDAAGGVKVDVSTTVRDTYSGFSAEPGCQRLDGRAALALARSRHIEIKRNGRWRTDVSASDFGRIDRQAVLMDALTAELIGPSLPLRVPGLIRVAQGNLVVDRNLSGSDVVSLARAYASAGANLEHLTLPGRPGRVGDASVVFEERAAAAEVLAALARDVPGAVAPRDPEGRLLPEPELAAEPVQPTSLPLGPGLPSVPTAPSEASSTPTAPPSPAATPAPRTATSPLSITPC